MYSFIDLTLDDYTVQFERVDNRKFTANDQQNSGSMIDASSVGSDADTESEIYGQSTLTISLIETTCLIPVVRSAWSGRLSQLLWRWH